MIVEQNILEVNGEKELRWFWRAKQTSGIGKHSEFYNRNNKEHGGRNDTKEYGFMNG